jgi:hypothetical protein
VHYCIQPITAPCSYQENRRGLRGSTFNAEKRPFPLGIGEQAWRMAFCGFEDYSMQMQLKVTGG